MKLVPASKGHKPKGQAVYEPFSGSGTTIMACELTERSCHAIELNPAYVDVAIMRWQDFTGQHATLESTNQTFEEVKDARYGKAKKQRRKAAEARSST